MNTPAKIEHEAFMTEEDIAIYDQMISMGRLQLGKELAKNEEFLLHLASMITIKQMKGMMVDIDDPSILELKRIHKEFQSQGLIHETPPDCFYESARVLKEPYLPDDVQKEIAEMNAMTSNLIIEDKKNIENEVVDDDIKTGYVKIVAP
jgi:hypothetical protein